MVNRAAETAAHLRDGLRPPRNSKFYFPERLTPTLLSRDRADLAWPFTHPRYLGRDLSWAEWLALPDLDP